MKLQYETPEMELLIFSAEDIITTSPGLHSGSNGSGGGNFSFNEWNDQVGNYGDGEETGDGGGIDIGDLFN